MRTKCWLKIAYCYGLRMWITGQTVDWRGSILRSTHLCWQGNDAGVAAFTAYISTVLQATHEAVAAIRTATTKQIQMATQEALPLRCQRPKQGGIWCDQWSSCCNVISLCWMERPHPVAYWSLTGRLFGNFEVASIKWEIIIAVLRCLSDCVLAHYAQSCVRSCWRRWNREKMAGNGTHDNAMWLCIHVLPVPPASALCTCHIACIVSIRRAINSITGDTSENRLSVGNW